MRPITLFLFILVPLIGANREYEVCYKCISNYVVYQWEKVNLARSMRFEDEIAGDDNCKNASYPHPTIRCNGRCALFTVLAYKNDQEYIFGTYRDCDTAYAFTKFLSLLDDTTERVEMELKPVSGFERKAVFQVCDHNLCNGKKATVVRVKNYAHSALLSNFLLLLLIAQNIY